MRRAGCLLLLWMGAAMADILDDAQAHFQSLQSYQVTLQSHDGAGVSQIVRYAYRKPGWVRMDFLEPHRGAVLIYDPGVQRVRVWPFGLNWSFSVSLSPDHPLLRAGNDHRVDKSDIGVLLARLQALRAHGQLTSLGEAEVGGQPALGLAVSGAPGEPRFRVWLTRDTLFPLRVERSGVPDEPPETVEMLDARIDAPLPERFFTP